MPVVCAVIGCNAVMGKLAPRKTSFFRFPTTPKRYPRNSRKCLLTTQRRKWLANISRADLTISKLKYTRVCSRHFISGESFFYPNYYFATLTITSFGDK